MKVCLLIAAILIVVNGCVVPGAWLLMARQLARSRLARAGGALLGAAGGAWGAASQVLYVTERVCEHSERDWLCQAALPVPMLYVYPFALPLTTALYAWLFAELVGGRTVKPLRTGAWAVAGAMLATVMVFVPIFFIPGVEGAIPSPMRKPLIVAAPAVGAVLALVIADSRVRPHGRAESRSTTNR